MQVIHLTQPLDETGLSYPGTAFGMALVRRRSVDPECIASHLADFDVHFGTHLDAPLHFIGDGIDVSQMPLAVPDIVVIDCSASPILPAALESSGRLCGKAVLFSTHWERYVRGRRYFEGYPTLDVATAERLVDEGVRLVGVDTPSVDPPDGCFGAHRALLGAGIPILEGLVGLMELRLLLAHGRGARLAAFPLRLRGLEASPVRAVALLDDREEEAGT